jgi:hypothetical protein
MDGSHVPDLLIMQASSGSQESVTSWLAVRIDCDPVLGRNQEHQASTDLDTPGVNGGEVAPSSRHPLETPFTPRHWRPPHQWPAGDAPRTSTEFPHGNY